MGRLHNAGLVGLFYNNRCQRVGQNGIAGACVNIGGNLRGFLIAQSLVLLIAQEGSKGNCRRHVLGMSVHTDTLGAVESKQLIVIAVGIEGRDHGSGAINKDNVQEKMDTFVAAMTAE